MTLVEMIGLELLAALMILLFGDSTTGATGGGAGMLSGTLVDCALSLARISWALNDIYRVQGLIVR